MIDKGDAHIKYLPPRVAQSFYFTHEDEEEIKRHIKNMNLKKSPGHNSIRTFGNRCLFAIGGANRWSRFAEWVQLSAEAACTASATLCVQATMRFNDNDI